MRFKFLSFSNLTLLVALSLSSVAAWYSIIGLTAIFAGAVIPVIIMGSILEVGKITTTVWLRKYWHRAGWVLKLYLVPAVIALALLTSMGIFGFLSKAHMDSGIATGDSQSKLALYDEKIKTQRDNIELARKALTQMDAQVDQMLGRTDSDKGAERAVAIRKQQAKERASLQNDIGAAQKEISKLNEERAPIAAENRKIEAEVGPIKYIAALIYGDNADANMLEAAVRWVIILLVVVFDPLAIALVLAANASKEWDLNDDVEEENKLREKVAHDKEVETILEDAPAYEQDDGPLTDEQVDQLKKSVEAFGLPEGEVIAKEELFPEKTLAELHPYLNEPFSHFTDTTPIVHKPEVVEEVVEEVIEQPVNDPNILALGIDEIERPGDYLTGDSSMTVAPDLPYKVDGTGYATYQGKRMSIDALRGMHPEFFGLTADAGKAVNSSFGTKFPDSANKGDVFVRVDMLPNKVYKFDSKNWIAINKETTNTYLYNTKYVEYLIDMIAKGEYDAELLSENESIQIEDYLKIQKNLNKNG